MYLKCAYVTKAQGIKGELFVRPFNPKPQWPPVREIFIDGRAFSVINYRPHKEGFVFKLKGCDSREAALSLKGKGVFLPKKLFESGNKKGEGFYLAELLSFQVESLPHGIIGRIHSFQSGKLYDFLYVVASNESSKELLQSTDKELNPSDQVLLDESKKSRSTAKGQKTWTIPFIKAYIEEISFSAKKVILALPEDFLQIFASK